MDHKTRLHIAHELKKKILKKHTDAILGIAIYGSVAKNEDRKYSDLEMFVITRRKLKKREVRYVYDDMAVEVSYIFSRDMLRNARQVTPNWAIEADFYRNYLILYEKNKWFTKLKRAVEAQDTLAFKKAIRKYLVWLHELRGKIKNAYVYGDDRLFQWLTAFLGWESALLLGLMNRHYIQSERTVFEEVLSLPVLPRDYENLLAMVFRFSANDRRKTYAGAMRLFRELTRLAQEQGVVLTQKKLRI